MINPIPPTGFLPRFQNVWITSDGPALVVTDTDAERNVIPLTVADCLVIQRELGKIKLVTPVDTFTRKDISS